jgi:hypothetical protein
MVLFSQQRQHTGTESRRIGERNGEGGRVARLRPVPAPLRVSAYDSDDVDDGELMLVFDWGVGCTMYLYGRWAVM